MLIYAIDDEAHMLTLLHRAIAEAAPDAQIRDYPLSMDALAALRAGDRPDVVFADIEMPPPNGLEFAVALKKLSPDTKLVFVTGYSEYAAEAYRLHAEGYIMKPVPAERVSEELELMDLLDTTSGEKLNVRCFGYFDVFWKGEPLVFARSRTKELFAYLVDRTGSACRAEEVIAALFENTDTEEMKQAKQNLRNLINDLPLAVSVAVVDADVNVAKSAVIEAARDISIGSKADPKVATRSDSSLGNAPEIVQDMAGETLSGAPIAIAVAVLLNDVHTNVDGTLKAGRNVLVGANGTLDAKSIADKGEGQKSISGGYVAVTVALQDVKAELGAHANVAAAGSVKVDSAASEKVDNRATSGAQDSEQPEEEKTLGGESGKAALNVLKEKLWPKIKEYFSSETAKEKLDKQIKKIATSDHSVKLDEDAERKGTVKITEEGGTVKAKVTAWEGYVVKSVTWRGYDSGEGKYISDELDLDEMDDDDTLTFKLTKKNVTLFVEYEEIEGHEDVEPTAGDLFDDHEQDEDIDLQKLIDDATSGTNESSNSLDLTQDLMDKTDIPLKLNNKDEGSVLTYDTKVDSDECLDKLFPGQQLRLVPNPADGKKLKEGGLKATYYVKEDDKQVKKTVVVAPDAKGRYTFTVPETLDKYFGVSVTAEFENKDGDEDSDETQSQVTGAIAVVVSDNDNDALVDQGAKITAGSVAVDAKADTDIANLADGTAISKQEASKAEKSDDLSIKRAEAKECKYSMDLSALRMDEGSTAVVSFAFAKEGEYGKAVSRQAAQAIIAHPIRLSYNSIKKEGTNDAQRGATGTLSYTVSTKDGKTSYLFSASPNADKGYVLDGSLKATWTNASGAAQTAELSQNDAGQWVLDPEEIPVGAPITVTAAFKDDLHDFKVDADETKNGTVTLHDEKVKTSDNPKFTVEPQAGYSIDDVTVTYMSGGIKRTVKLSDEKSKIEKAKEHRPVHRGHGLRGPDGPLRRGIHRVGKGRDQRTDGFGHQGDRREDRHGSRQRLRPGGRFGSRVGLRHNRRGGERHGHYHEGKDIGRDGRRRKGRRRCPDRQRPLQAGRESTWPPP
ncbi:MAG: response regulator [Clostridiales bacterium]|nr:response regulator [Clostridiales bacterium]